MSFYRTYRPEVIEELDGESIRKRLFSLLHKPKKEYPHAYFFTGSRGTGKTTCARIIAKIFNCTKPDKDNAPCGSCSMCKSIHNGSAIDVIEIDAASNTGVDNIRELRNRIALSPSKAEYKVYIIDEVHMLSTGAFNALLKTLEEPPPHAIFILATTNAEKVPITIKSRCVSFVFARPDSTELKRSLKRVIKREKIKIDEDAIDLLISQADGSFRDAVKILEQASFHKGDITREVIREILSLTDTKTRSEFIKCLFEGNAGKSLDYIQTLIKGGANLRSFLISCIQDVEELLITTVSKGADNYNITDVRLLLRLLNQAYVELKTASLPQLPIELAVVEYCENNKKILQSEKSYVNTSKSDTEKVAKNKEEKVVVSSKKTAVSESDDSKSDSLKQRDTSNENTEWGMLSLTKLTDHWADFIEETKPYNHSVAGVLRSSKPKDIKDDVVIIEAFYPFHLEKLSEGNTRLTLGKIIHKLFGKQVKVDIVLGKK